MTRAATTWPAAGIAHAGGWWSPDGLTWHELAPTNRNEVIDGGGWKILARVYTPADAVREMRAGLNEALGAKAKAGG